MKKLLLIKFLLVSFTLSLILANTGESQVKEQMILITDRTVYTAGENLLYNLFLLDVQNKLRVSYPSIGYIIVKDAEGKLVGKGKMKMVSGRANGGIYLSDTLKTGYYQVTAYTNFMRNGSINNFGSQSIVIANRFDTDFSSLYKSNYTENDSAPPSTSDNLQDVKASEKEKYLSITPNRTIFKKREKVILKIEPDVNSDDSLDLAISVVESNTYESKQEHSGNNNLLSAQVVKSNLPMQFDKPGFLAEDKFEELRGRIKDTNSGAGLSGRILYLSSPDSIANLQYAVSDSSGYFRFPVSGYYNGRDIFLKIADDRPAQDYNLVIDSKYDNNNPFILPSFRIDSSFIYYLQHSQEVVRVRKSFAQISSVGDLEKYNQSTPRVYYKADYRILPADYTELNDFVEISREILPPFKVRKTENGYHGEMIDYDRKTFFQQEPLIFIDGVLVDDVNQVIALGSKDIQSIEMIASEWIFGSLAFPGVISIKSTHQAWKNIPLSKSNLRLKAGAYFKAPEANGPNYSIVPLHSREPDFRQLLYWNPRLHISNKKATYVEFYTSDYAASYTIKVKGVGSNGSFINAYQTIQVIE